ncbi:hypothetical protein BDZ90DRAFT_35247 [Jaminaea rosea]|uniref:Uncharacterized protein n=1 Tax=Jaminaea rosea TaxID=1569628 RepID=A0A316V6N8_9BASI|nr:hypothetical protein BDZ90DRAFT_35247 [Jaminaea rosea]PWN31115.1 hypothetical protein BDZ90DRAFT_35247 [Jaminaea rosea]
MSKLSAETIRQAAQGAYKMATPFALELVTVLNMGLVDVIKDGEYWEARQGSSANSKLSMDASAEVMTAGVVYLRVEIISGRLAGIYVGRTGWAWFRLTEHIATILFDYLKDSQYAYQTARAADVVLTFNLFEDKTADRHDAAAWPTRAIIEAIWALLLGSYDRNEECCLVRRRYGLVELGEAVRRCNGTRCFEAPETGMRTMALHNVQRRLQLYLHQIRTAVPSANGRKHAHFLVLYQIGQDVRCGLTGLLLASGAYINVNTTGQNPFLFPIGGRGRRQDVARLRDIAKSGRWSFRLVEGGETSLLSMGPVDMALYGKLALIGSSADKKRYGDEEVVFYFDAAPMAVETRLFWEQVLLMLPAESAAHRRRAHREAADAVIARRAADHHALDIRVRLAWDGLLTMSTVSGNISLFDVVVPTLRGGGGGGRSDTVVTRRRSMLGALQQATGVGQGVSGRGTTAAVPLQLDVWGTGATSGIEGGRSNWTWRVFAADRHEWVDQPYQMEVSGLAVAVQTEPLFRVFGDLERVYGSDPARAPTLAFFRSILRPITLTSPDPLPNKDDGYGKASVTWKHAKAGGAGTETFKLAFDESGVCTIFANQRRRGRHHVGILDGCPDGRGSQLLLRP